MDLLPFSKEEYDQRLRRVRDRMAEQKVDAAIFTRPSNIYYLTGYKAAVMNWTLPLLPLLVPAQGPMWFMTRQIEAATIRRQLVADSKTYKDHEDPFEKVRDALAKRGFADGRLGIEMANLTVAQFESFRSALPSARWSDVSGMVERIRIRLSPQEVEYYRLAAKVTNIGMDQGMTMLRPGARCADVIGEMQKAVYQSGQTDVEVPKMWIWSGPEGGMMHDTDVSRKLESGDLVTLEVWGTAHQYLAGSQKTFFLGRRPPARAVESQKMLADMYLAAKQAIRVGVASSDAFHAANQVFKSLCGDDYWRRIGANMGLTFGPVDMGMTGVDTILSGTPFILQLVEVDPFLVTCCATVLLTDEGVEELTPPLLELPGI